MGIYGYGFDVFNTPMYLPFWHMLETNQSLPRPRHRLHEN